MDRVKKSKLYQPSGYPDIEYLLNKGLPFMWLIGGRGIGKTYTILETIVLIIIRNLSYFGAKRPK